MGRRSTPRAENQVHVETKEMPSANIDFGPRTWTFQENLGGQLLRVVLPTAGTWRLTSEYTTDYEHIIFSEDGHMLDAYFDGLQHVVEFRVTERQPDGEDSEWKIIIIRRDGLSVGRIMALDDVGDGEIFVFLTGARFAC